MKFGHRLRSTITAVDDHGRGLMETEVVPGVPTITAVPKSMIGDTIVARFLKRDHHVNTAQLDEVITPSPDRITAPCPHANICGGCLWQHMEYNAQTKLKLELVNRALEKAGHEERIETITKAEEQFRHRNRMDYVVGWKGEIGLKEYGSWNRYVDLSTCLLLREGVDAILTEVRAWMKEQDLQPWDAKFYTGDIRYVVIRDGQRTAQRHITIVVKSFERINEHARKNIHDRLDGSATSILIGEQSLQTDISQAQQFVTLKGAEYLEEIVNDIRYRIYPNSFFQTNTRMAEVLQNAVIDKILDSRLRGNDGGRGRGNDAVNVLDLYCGLGFFSIAIAKQLPFASVHGVELDEAAIVLANQNAALNDVANRCTFLAEKSESLSWTNSPADIVIVDPPRAGLHPKVVEALITMKPKKIIYVSCNVNRLAEELKRFKTHYCITSLEAFDLFPHTPHAEVVCVMEIS